MLLFDLPDRSPTPERKQLRDEQTHDERYVNEWVVTTLSLSAFCFRCVERDFSNAHLERRVFCLKA